MLLEVAKPIALALCMISLCAVFYTAFMVPSNNLEKTVWDSVVLLSFAAGICLTSGMMFRGSKETGIGALTRTLPVQMFCWAVCLMLVFFAASWYLETYCIFYKDVRRF